MGTTKGCLPLLAFVVMVGVAGFRLLWGGRLVFVAPSNSTLHVTIDKREPFMIKPGEDYATRVFRGEHTITTLTDTGTRTLSLKSKADETLLVPASDEQCFLVLDISEAYSNEEGGKVLPAHWLPPIVEELSSDVTTAPANIGIRRAPNKIRHEVGSAIRVLLPFQCGSSPDGVVSAWTRANFGPRK